MIQVREYLKKRGYVKDEDGSIIVFVMVVFSAMFLVGGTAVDLARHEDLRSSLQYNLDRAVLAAASLKQTRDPDEVVQDYMSKAVTISTFTVSVDSSVATNSRSVEATAYAELDTWFLSLAGIDDMPIRRMNMASTTSMIVKPARREEVGRTRIRGSSPPARPARGCRASARCRGESGCPRRGPAVACRAARASP